MIEKELPVMKYKKEAICYLFVSVSGIEACYICWNGEILAARNTQEIEAVILHLVPAKTRIVFDSFLTGIYLAERLKACGYNVSICEPKPL